MDKGMAQALKRLLYKHKLSNPSTDKRKEKKTTRIVYFWKVSLSYLTSGN
jgi:hypothetical protein